MMASKGGVGEEGEILNVIYSDLLAFGEVRSDQRNW